MTWLNGLAGSGSRPLRRDRAPGPALAAGESAAAAHRDAGLPRRRRRSRLILGVVLFLVGLTEPGQRQRHGGRLLLRPDPVRARPVPVPGRPREGQVLRGTRLGDLVHRLGARRRARRAARGARARRSATPPSSSPTGCPDSEQYVDADGRPVASCRRLRRPRRDRGRARRPPDRGDRARPDAARRPGAGARGRRRGRAGARERAARGRAARQGRGAARLAQAAGRRRPAASGGGSSATCTTARSSGWCRWRSTLRLAREKLGWRPRCRRERLLERSARGAGGGAQGAARAGPRHPPGGAHRPRPGRGGRGARPPRAAAGRARRAARRAATPSTWSWPPTSSSRRRSRTSPSTRRRVSATVAVLPGERPASMVEVTDDGVGGARPERGTGLRGLAARLESIDGRLDVESEPGRGTAVRARIPCE